MRNRFAAIAGGLLTASALLVGCSSAPGTSVSSAEDTAGMVQEQPQSDKVEASETVCGSAIFNGLYYVHLVHGALTADTEDARKLIIGDQRHFEITNLSRGFASVVSVSALVGGEDAQPVEACNSYMLVVPDEAIELAPAEFTSPSTVCMVSYFDPTHVALTTLDDHTYLASYEYDRYVLPGEVVVLSSDGKTVSITEHLGNDASSCYAFTPWWLMSPTAPQNETPQTTATI